jgi:predicted enzyme related to lactoylglutathione lyase
MGVTGIGGLFFRSRDPAARAAWYKTHLGIDAGHEALWQQQAGPTVFAPFSADSDYFAKDQPFMLNLRVEGLKEFAHALETTGIAVERRPEWDMPDIGLFMRIRDPEGLPIELWEPAG